MVNLFFCCSSRFSSSSLEFWGIFWKFLKFFEIFENFGNAGARSRLDGGHILQQNTQRAALAENYPLPQLLHRSASNDFENFRKFWNFLNFFENFWKFLKIWKISKIFEHFENFENWKKLKFARSPCTDLPGFWNLARNPEKNSSKIRRKKMQNSIFLRLK